MYQNQLINFMRKVGLNEINDSTLVQSPLFIEVNIVYLIYCIKLLPSCRRPHHRWVIRPIRLSSPVHHPIIDLLNENILAHWEDLIIDLRLLTTIQSRQTHFLKATQSGIGTSQWNRSMLILNPTSIAWSTNHCAIYHPVMIWVIDLRMITTVWSHRNHLEPLDLTC